MIYKGTGFHLSNLTIRVTSLVLLALLTGLFMYAQPPGLSLGKVGVCTNSTVSVPLTGNNLTDIGAITLFIHYDSLSLSFKTIENIDPQLSNGLIFNTLSNPPRVAIVWSKTTGANFPNSTLLNLKFDILQKSGIVQFVKDNCEIANVSLPPQIIAVNYTDGSIFESTPVIAAEPENKTVFSQSNAIFEVSSPNATAFFWQESRNNGTLWSDLSETNTYTGTHSNTLTIKQIPVNYNKFMYRCLINANSCVAVTSSATLSVDSIAGISGQPSHASLRLSVSPNPSSGNTMIEYSVPEHGKVTIKIFSMSGKLLATPVESPHVAGLYRINDNFVYLPAGVYYCQYVFNGSASVYETYRKIIKIN
ncbi:MAG: T9SS type A sorting domain-containing protein [Bacteroidales bacterium]